MSASDRTEAGALSEVTRDLVRLHTEYYGKGPTKARTYMVNDMLISILEGGFTTVETDADRRGAATPSMSMRRSFQLAMEDRFRAVVEKATGRRVIAYMSQIHTGPDMAVELFVLEPRVRTSSQARVDIQDESDGRPRFEIDSRARWVLPQLFPSRVVDTRGAVADNSDANGGERPVEGRTARLGDGARSWPRSPPAWSSSTAVTTARARPRPRPTCVTTR